tara:strand:+ start:199 stop:378 length:180 start_codon:yes stop_codon:yes gene_type:complete
VEHQKEEQVIHLLQIHLKVIQVDLEHPQDQQVLVVEQQQLEEMPLIIGVVTVELEHLIR